MRQFTHQQCVSLHASGLTKNFTDEQICRLQLMQNKICFDEIVFLKAIQTVLNRPVTTFEIAHQNQKLLDEYRALPGKTEPTMEEVKSWIPEKDWWRIGEQKANLNKA